MRVIAGTARGVPLDAPRDRSTRPITDRVKETLFGILGPRVPGAIFLDLYAGSGAIGIEALSRGAARATLVERHRDAVAVIRANLARTGLAEGASVHAEPVERFLGRAAEDRYDIVVLDPPYAERAILAPLAGLTGLLAPGAVVVVKHFWRTELPGVAGLLPVRERRFGETMLTFLEADR